MKLIALDLDGTLFNNKSQISKENIKAIKEATAAGINVVISTGRPFGGLPFEAIKGTGIRYAITANGSAIYEIYTKKCLYENCLTDETAFSIIAYLMPKRDHIDALLGDLKERERQVIELRFGLRDGHPRTLEEVGKEFYVTRERIRQIEAKALRKLRHPSRSKKLKDFLD